MSKRIALTGDDDPAALDAAAAALDAGGVVVVPTETVYGLAAREDRPAGVAALERLKPGRSAPYSRAVADLEVVAGRLTAVSGLARRIAERWWPGPVTQVLATRDGGWLGVRVPGHPWTRELCARVGAPLLLPSANPPGAPAPRSLDALAPTLVEGAALVVDGGACALGEASTVLQVDGPALRVLREGVVTRADLERHVRGRVLVVCSGNTCRSPMGAELLADAFARRAASDPAFLPPEVLSAGTHAAPGHPASPAAVDALEARGLDLAAHASRPLDPDLLASADLVLAMTMGHLAAAVAAVPGAAFEAALFDPDGTEIDDPFGAPPNVYAAVAGQLARMADARAAQLCAPLETNR